MSSILTGLQLNELSNKKLGDYKTAAGADATAADKAGDYKRGDKRMSGIIKATKKEFANDKKKKVTEAGMPFRGVGGAFNRGDDERHDLDPSEWYIVKDGKMYKTSVYPNQEQQAIAQGYSRSREEAKSKSDRQGMAEGLMNKIANKVMGAAPEQPKYKVGQRVKYETSPHQPDWKDVGRGVGVITAYKNGHYMINGNPVNHFEIKGVVDQGVAEGSEQHPGVPTSRDELYHHHLSAAKISKGRAKEHHLQQAEKYKPKQGVAEGSEPQVGDAVYYGKRLVGWFKGYSEHGKIITEPNEGEMGDEYSNRDVYWDQQDKITIRPEQGVAEEWSQKYKSSINCSHPKGFSQKAHCAGKKKNNESAETPVMEMVCEDCGMCETHGDHTKDQLDELKCWSGYHRVAGTKAGFPGSCAKNKTNEEDISEGVAETLSMDDAVKVLRQYGADHFKTTSNELHFYKQGRPFSVDLVMNPDATRSVTLSSLNSATRGLKGQGIAEEQHSCPHCGGEMVSEELMNEKKDACYYKVKSRYKVWPSAYASGALVKCRKSGADSWGDGGKKNESSILEGINRVDESLHDWFNKEKWVRMDTKGKIKGPCAKEPGEGKPKCLPQAKAHSLGKKGRASAASRKRREDPNPERSGKAINVNTKKKD